MSGWKKQMKSNAILKQLQDLMVANGAKMGPGGKGGAGPKADAKGGKTWKTGKGAAAKGGAAAALVYTCCGKNGSHKTQDCNYIHEACDHCGKYGHRSRCWYSPSALAAAAGKAGGKGAAAAGGKGPQAPAPAAGAAAAAAAMVCNCCGEKGHKKP